MSSTLQSNKKDLDSEDTAPPKNDGVGMSEAGAKPYAPPLPSYNATIESPNRAPSQEPKPKPTTMFRASCTV